MPKKQPTQSFQMIRNYTEKFSWRDKRTGLVTVGYNPPKNANELKRVPFYIRFVTGKGLLEEGYCECIKVFRRKHQRMVKFVDSGEIRMVRDYLVIEIDGTRFVTN